MRTLIFIVLMSFQFSIFAKDLKRDIEMVSYEQRWLDRNGTIALKNNTNENINNVAYKIIYLDMSNKPIDYEEFQSSINIAPGMTRKIDIPAYERDRHYQYYKTKDIHVDYPTFKIEFELVNYNLETDKTLDGQTIITENNTEKSNKNIFSNILMIVCLSGVFIFFACGLYVLVAVMAKNRNRNPALWIFLSLFITPLLIILILLCIGKNENYMTPPNYNNFN